MSKIQILASRSPSQIDKGFTIVIRTVLAKFWSVGNFQYMLPPKSDIAIILDIPARTTHPCSSLQRH